MKWMRVIVLIIGLLVIIISVCGILAWSISQQEALVILSSVFVFIGVALVAGALAWPKKRE